MRAAGTVHAAGWLIIAPGQPDKSMPNSVVRTAPVDSNPPVSIPAMAPDEVTPFHQIPKSNNGKKVDAATAKASSTDLATGSPIELIVRIKVSVTAAAAATRNRSEERRVGKESRTQQEAEHVVQKRRKLEERG